MYRKRNGSLSFSFGRFISNAVPNFASSWEPGTIDISRQRRDMLYAHQTVKPWPTCLEFDERSFYVAGVCDRERQSERIFFALLKNGVLVDAVPDGDSEETDKKPLGANIDTTKIGPKFIHQLAFISQTSQKNLISVLFFWEEEVHRLRKLDAEEKDLDTLINEAEQRAQVDDESQQGALDRLKFARERVRMKRRQRPSQRDPRVERDEDAMVAQAFSVPQVQTNGSTMQPPTYKGHAFSV